MPVCKECSAPFPNRVHVDGKLRVVCNRHYCLDCLPFRSGRLRAKNKPIEKRICQTCKREFIYRPRSGQTKGRCNSCITAARRIQTKRRAVELLGGACALCGYNRCMAALTFHHRDPEKKDFIIAHAYNRSWETVAAELLKCVLLCQNCHAEVHDGIAVLTA